MAFEELTPVSFTDHIIQTALGRGRKKAALITNRDNLIKNRKRELARIQTMQGVAIQHLNVEQFPSIDKLSPFYQHLFNDFIDVDAYKVAHSRVKGSVTVIKRISTIYQKKIQKAENQPEIKQLANQYIGRFSSVIKKITNSLKKSYSFL